MTLITLLISVALFANEPTPTTQSDAAAVMPRKTLNKITVKDAKAECKEEGKSGKELLECIKAKKSK